MCRAAQRSYDCFHMETDQQLISALHRFVAIYDRALEAACRRHQISPFQVRLMRDVRQGVSAVELKRRIGNPIVGKAAAPALGRWEDLGVSPIGLHEVTITIGGRRIFAVPGELNLGHAGNADLSKASDSSRPARPL